MSTTRKAEIISIGTELTSGQNLDTNAQWLSRRLAEMGVVVGWHTTLADDLPSKIAALVWRFPLSLRASGSHLSILRFMHWRSMHCKMLPEAGVLQGGSEQRTAPECSGRAAPGQWRRRRSRRNT